MTQVRYRFDKEIAVEQWLHLYRACDWNREWTARNAEVMLGHAYLVVTAWLGDEIIGTLTVLSDGLNYATIDDVVVHPQHRGRGIGSQLVRLAVEQVGHLEPHLEAVPGTVPFYESMGFVPNRGHTGMFWPPAAVLR